MRLRAIVLALLGLTTVSFQSRAVTTYSSSFLEKTIATATIPDRNDMVLYFSVVVGTFKGAEIHGVAFGDGIYYQLTGTSTIFLSDKSKTLNSGDGIFIPFGVHFTLKTADAGQRPTYLEFLLLPAAGHQPIDDSNHTQSEVFRSPAPVLGLMPERNLLTLSEVEVPPQSPCDALHWRSGAALHYILSGVGAEFTRNRAIAKGPGSISYEPNRFAYQWSNPNTTRLVYLLFNVNPKDEPPVVAADERPIDPFAGDVHLTRAMYCIGFSMILTAIIAVITACNHDAMQNGGRRGRK
jgi:hypothetical protein